MSSNSSREQTTVSFVRFLLHVVCNPCGASYDTCRHGERRDALGSCATRPLRFPQSRLHKALPNTRFVKPSARRFHRVFEKRPGQFHPARRVVQQVLQSKRALLFRQAPVFSNFHRSQSAANSMKILSLSSIVKGQKPAFPHFPRATGSLSGGALQRKPLPSNRQPPPAKHKWNTRRDPADTPEPRVLSRTHARNGAVTSPP